MKPSTVAGVAHGIWLPKCAAKLLLRCAALCEHHLPHPLLALTAWICCCAVPVMDRAPEEPPPFVVLVQGPAGVGKSTLIRGLVRHYTRHSLGDVRGPITVVSGKARRLTFVECPPVSFRASHVSER